MPLKSVLDFIIKSQIFVAFCGTLLALFFCQNLGSAQIFIIFFTYFGGYIHTKFGRSRFQKTGNFVNIFLGILILFLYYKLGFQHIERWIFIFILGICYNSFLFFRKIPFVKIFYVGVVWALVNSWLFTENFSLKIFVPSFLFISALIIPFDIRDLKFDKIKTLPNFIGIRNSKILAIFFIVISTVVVWFHFDKNQITAWNLASFLAIFLVFKSKPQNHGYFFSVLVEFCTALPYLVYCVLNKL